MKSVQNVYELMLLPNVFEIFWVGRANSTAPQISNRGREMFFIGATRDFAHTRYVEVLPLTSVHRRYIQASKHLSDASQIPCNSIVETSRRGGYATIDD